MSIFRRLLNFFDEQESVVGERTYHDPLSRFKFTLPGRWKERQPLNEENPEFDGPGDASIKFAIGPISPEPGYREHLSNLKGIVAKYGHEVLKVGNLEVAGKTHATMVCQVPISPSQKLKLKNYHLIFHGIEYMITALLATVDLRLGQTRVHEREERYDSIVKSFREIELDADPKLALRAALSLENAGEFDAATNLLKSAVARTPHSSKCLGETAEQKFDLLLLWADATKKGAGDAKAELDILNECLPLVEKLPPPSPGSDRLTNKRYVLHANRASALSRLGLYGQEADAWEAARQAARDSETKCKCLAYLGWAILLQRDNHKLGRAWNCFEEFEAEAAGKDIPHPLQSVVKSGWAVRHLHNDEISHALGVAEQAVQLDESNGIARELSRYLRNPGVTAAKAMEFILDQAEGRAPRQSGSKNLPPLQSGI